MYPAVTASVPPSVSSASNDPEGGGNSRVFGASKLLGAPTTGASIREGGGGNEKKQQQRQEKTAIRSSGVSRLRQMFERNNSDSKKRASLEARPLRRPIAAMAVSSIGEHEVVNNTAAIVAPASVDAAVESVSLDATAGVQLPAVGIHAVETAPVVALEATTAGPAPTPVPTKKDGSSAAEESNVAVKAVGTAAEDEPSVDDVTMPGVMTNPPILGASTGAFSTPTTEMDQAPIATVKDVIQVSVVACQWHYF